MKMSRKGISLMEVLLAMLVLGLASTAIFTAFSFGRKVSWRSEMEIMVQTYSQQLLENLRLAVLGDPALSRGLTILPGVYVDQKLGNAGPFATQNPAFIPPAGATPLAVLNLPIGTLAADPVGNLRRFQTNPGTPATPGNPAIPGDGVTLFVEGLGADLDGDGQKGIDFDSWNGVTKKWEDSDADGQADLLRVRLRVQWTLPDQG